MRILLIGEYSRLHNSLKEALTQSGHDVTIVGTGDGFKNFPVDHDIDAKWCKNGLPNIFRQAIFRIFNYDIAKIEYGIRFKKLLPQLGDFDVVQLISDTPLLTNLSFEYKLMKAVRSRTKKMFMLSSGTDVAFMDAITGKKFRYSLMDPYFANKSLIAEYRHVLPKLSDSHRHHYAKMVALCDGIIATDIDYAIALQGKVGSSRVDLQACKLEYSIVSPK